MCTRSKAELFVIVCAVALGCFAGFFPSPASASSQWDVGISGGKGGIRDFHLSVGDYYDAPEREVEVIHDRGMDDEEIPVVYHIARHAHVRPVEVVELRHRGMSWMEITDHYRLSPEIYYVPMRGGEGIPSHGRAYGYYRDHPGSRDWRRVRLSDRDVVNQVNTRFIAGRYGYAPERVMRSRAEGRRFDAIERDIRHERYGNGDGGNVRHRGGRFNDRGGRVRG